MLYLIATPIGNLGDITFRAVEILKSCDRLYVEDTRRASQLLHHLEIKKPLTSFHSFNEKSREEEIVSRLQKGETLGILSDAGMPIISDPGAQIIHRLQKEDLPYSVIPGASALTAAIALSGSLREKFQFLGFLSKKTSEIKKSLQEALTYSGLSVFYVSPHNLLRVLSFLPPEKEVTLVREISKLHEEVLRKAAQQMTLHFKTHPLKGELVLLIEGQGLNKSRPQISFEEALKLLMPHMSDLRAAKIARKLVGTS